MAHTNPAPPNVLYIWTGLSLFPLESGGRATYMEAHPNSLSPWKELEVMYLNSFIAYAFLQKLIVQKNQVLNGSPWSQEMDLRGRRSPPSASKPPAFGSQLSSCCHVASRFSAQLESFHVWKHRLRLRALPHRRLTRKIYWPRHALTTSNSTASSLQEHRQYSVLYVCFFITSDLKAEGRVSAPIAAVLIKARSAQVWCDRRISYFHYAGGRDLEKESEIFSRCVYIFEIFCAGFSRGLCVWRFVCCREIRGDLCSVVR